MAGKIIAISKGVCYDEFGNIVPKVPFANVRPYQGAIDKSSLEMNAIERSFLEALNSPNTKAIDLFGEVRITPRGIISRKIQLSIETNTR